MTITKCDICKKEIKKDEAELSLRLSGGAFDYINRTVCMTCVAPVMPFIKKHQLNEGSRSGARMPRRAA